MKTAAFVAALALTAAVVAASTFKCTSDSPCQTIIRCDPTEPCSVQCLSDQICQEHRIECPADQPCAVECNAGKGALKGQACQQADIIIPTNSTMKLDCVDDEACEEARINNDCNTPECAITCTGERACHHMICSGDGCPPSD